MVMNMNENLNIEYLYRIGFFLRGLWFLFFIRTEGKTLFHQLIRLTEWK